MSLVNYIKKNRKPDEMVMEAKTNRQIQDYLKDVKMGVNAGLSKKTARHVRRAMVKGIKNAGKTTTNNAEGFTFKDKFKSFFGGK